MKNKLRDLRLSANLSQTDLARLAGVGRSTITEIEASASTPTVETALKIARALHVSVEDLFML